MHPLHYPTTSAVDTVTYTATAVWTMPVYARIQKCGRRYDELEVESIEAHVNTLFIVHFFGNHQFLEVLA